MRTNGNRILSAMAPEGAERLAPYLEEVSLVQHQVLIEAGRPLTRAYFPHDTLVSLVTMLEDGLNIETATIGREGVAGLPLLVNHEVSPSRMIVLAPGQATAIATAPLQRALEESAGLRALFASYVQAFVANMLQNVACNAAHSTEERLAKWLLTSADRSDGRGIPVTHESLAEMLGVGRPTVSLVARALQNAGLIEYRRGLISIVDRAGLEGTSCACYGAIRHAFESLLPSTYR